NASESKEATGTEESESKAGDATGSKETAAKESESKADDKSSPAAAGEQGKSAAQSSGAADTNPLSKRRSLWKACVDSFVYVNNISQDEAVKVRDSDRATSIW